MTEVVKSRRFPLKWIVVAVLVLGLLGYCTFQDSVSSKVEQSIFDKEYRGEARDEFRETETYGEIQVMLEPSEVLADWNQLGVNTRELFKPGKIYRRTEADRLSIPFFDNFADENISANLPVDSGMFSLTDMVGDNEAIKSFQESNEPSVQTILPIGDFYVDARANYFFDGNAICLRRPYKFEIIGTGQRSYGSGEAREFLKDQNDPVSNRQREQRSILRASTIHIRYKYPVICDVYEQEADGYTVRTFLPDGREIFRDEQPVIERIEELDNTPQNRNDVSESIRYAIGLGE